jgi:hypothetical protein
MDWHQHQTGSLLSDQQYQRDVKEGRWREDGDLPSLLLLWRLTTVKQEIEQHHSAVY